MAISAPNSAGTWSLSSTDLPGDVGGVNVYEQPRANWKCLCGARQYAVRDEFRYAANCHCSNCRRATGAAFKPFAGIERDKLRLDDEYRRYDDL